MKNNKGISLIEIIIAVAVIGIVAMPLLHSFVLAIETNSKAKVQMQVTTVAQNEMEEVVSLPMDEIINATEWTAWTEDPATGVMEQVTETEKRQEATVFELKKDNLDMAGKSYDAKITLDAGTYGSEDVASIELMDFDKDAAYTETDELENKNLPGQEKTLIAWFVGKTRNNTEYVLNEMEKNVVVSIDEVTDASEKKMQKVTVTYEYECGGYTYTRVNSEKIFDNSATGATAEQLRNIYLFYWLPVYTIDYTGAVKQPEGSGAIKYYVDTNITVKNPKNIPVNLCLVKQRIKDTNQSKEEEKLSLTIYENAAMGPEDSNLKIRSNLKVNDSNISYYCSGGIVKKTAKKENFDYTGITDKKTKNLLYDVRIDVYPHETDPSERYKDENKVFTLEGTKES